MRMPVLADIKKTQQELTLALAELAKSTTGKRDTKGLKCLNKPRAPQVTKIFAALRPVRSADGNDLEVEKSRLDL